MVAAANMVEVAALVGDTARATMLAALMGGQALTSSELAGSVFMLGGHTDAKGGEGYNQTLSERRAETVKRFLMENYHIPAANLVSAGYGKNGLKNAADPFAAENRRVEIVNVADRQQASQ